MKVLILAGGLGTRLGEETNVKPKPMVGIGGFPILWHIMKIYSHYGFNEFVVLTGYKQEVIKDYFVNYYMNNSDVTVDLATNDVTVHQNSCEPWKVTLLYTGRNTMTAVHLCLIGNQLSAGGFADRPRNAQNRAQCVPVVVEPGHEIHLTGGSRVLRSCSYVRFCCHFNSSFRFYSFSLAKLFASAACRSAVDSRYRPLSSFL